ncbi:MAG: tetratricopeptide repeat protein, partial [Bacteroidales bacterium]|nr:tetratricopeptide repeat protein [Bacteroidales bacterium]
MRFFYILICVVFVTITNAQNELNSNLSAKVDQLNNEIITYKSSGELNLAASALNKLAYLYWNNNNTDEALKCFLQSATINEKLKNHNGKKFLYDNIAILYSDKQNCEKAQEYFIRSLKIVQSQGNKKVEIKSLVNLAVSYTECDNSKEAISYLNKALIIAKVLNDLKLIRNIYGQLAENYEINGDSQKSMEAFNFFSTFDKYVRDLEQKDKDQAHNQHISELANKTKHAEDVASEKQKALDNSIIQLKQTSDSLLLVEKMNEQQQEKLKAQERALIEKEARIKLANRFRNTIIFSLIILLSILILLYRQFTQKKKVNALLLEQNETLKQQKNKIEKHKDELEQINYQLNLKNIQILDSITYAKKIQDAILPYEKTIREKIPNFFIFYKPRDIVSGDFYWYSEKNGKHFIAAVDCTGHGVPGAFMSMIGNTLLNEIVNEKNIDKPSEILKRLNDGIVKILNQNKTKKDIQGDGMDISLC